MKKKYHLSLVVLYLISIPFLFSQNMNQEYIFTEKKDARINAILNVGENTYIGGSVNSCKRSAVGIITHQNDYQFFEPFNSPYGIWGINEMELRTTDSIIIGSGGWVIADDYYTPDDSPFVFGMDLDANLLFINHLTELGDIVPVFNLNTKVYLSHTLSGGIVIAYNNNIVCLNNVGEFQHKINYDFENEFNSINRANETTLYAYTKNELLIMNHAGEELDLINSDTDILDAYAADGNVYCLRTDGILIYNINTSTISYSNNHLDLIDNANGIIGNSNSIFLYEKGYYTDENGGMEIIQLNKNDLSIVDDSKFSFNKKRTTIKSVLATENDLQILGSTIIGKPFIKSKPILNELTFDDVEVELVSVTALGGLMVVDSTEITPEFTSYKLEGDVPYQFVVKNNSEDKTIHDLAIHRTNYGGVSCVSTSFYSHLDDLSILPGESKTFSGTFNVIGYYTSSPTIETPDVYVAIVGANHRFEMDFTDNTISQPIFITSNKEFHDLVTEWELYPNPIKDYICFNAILKETPDDIKITIYNSIGKKIKQILPNINGLEIQELISVNEIPNGLYFFTLNTGKGNETRTIVISNN